MNNAHCTCTQTQNLKTKIIMKTKCATNGRVKASRAEVVLSIFRRPHRQQTAVYRNEENVTVGTSRSKGCYMQQNSTAVMGGPENLS